MIECGELPLLKLIDCDKGKIGAYAKLVDDRNETAHPNGNIFFSTQAALDAMISKILRVADKIQTHSRPIIEHCYRDFLLQNHDPDEREYPDAADQIREVLIHGNYLSQKDIDICLGFDIAPLRAPAELRVASPAPKGVRLISHPLGFITPTTQKGIDNV